MKATWNGTVIAESDNTVLVEGNHYFPVSAVKQQYITFSNHKTSCPWKGQASYWSLLVDGELNLGYDASAFDRPLDGYGYVVAAGEPHPIRACSWTSTKLDGRAPAGKVLLRAFFGGVGFEAETRLPDEELVARAQAAWSLLLGLHGKPELVRVSRWPGGNPQVAPGHQALVARLVAGLPEGLSLLGAAFHGVGVPDCVRAAEACAAAILPEQKA